MERKGGGPGEAEEEKKAEFKLTDHFLTFKGNHYVASWKLGGLKLKAKSRVLF